MKTLITYITESSNINLSKIKKIINGLKYNIEEYRDCIHVIFNEDDYWDFENWDLTLELKNIYNELSKLTTVVKWNDRSTLVVKFSKEKDNHDSTNDLDDELKVKKIANIHSPQSNGLSIHDEELIDLASSTTYRSTIRKYIKLVDTPKAKKILRDFLSQNDVEWED